MTRSYRPSNGTEGEFFMADWCDRCDRDRAFRDGTSDSCPIAAATMWADVNSPDYPREWICDAEGWPGNPRCTAFVADGPAASREAELAAARADVRQGRLV